MSELLKKPTVGRIVHFFERDNSHPDKKIVPRAALITETMQFVPESAMEAASKHFGVTIEELKSAVKLTLFLPDGRIVAVKTPVLQGTQNGCWNWPELV